MGQRYIGGAIFPKTKICLDIYFWRKSKIAPISVFVAIILNNIACAPEPGKSGPGEAGAGKPAGAPPEGVEGVWGLAGSVLSPAGHREQGIRLGLA